MYIKQKNITKNYSVNFEYSYLVLILKDINKLFNLNNFVLNIAMVIIR